ncbi:MAG: acyl-CoA dehydratase activase [bacterium]
MLVAGIDVGARFVKAVLVDERGAVRGMRSSSAGYDTFSVVNQLINELSSELRIKVEGIKKIAFTGAGKGLMSSFADALDVSETKAAAKAVTSIYPEVRTIIEVGAEESKVLRINKEGAVEEIAVNEKCAAGTGSFAETMARALEMTLDEFAEKSLESEKRISMNAQCTVFAESEVVSLIHSGVDKKDIAKAVLDAIASRVAAMVRKVRLEPEVILIGGMAKNAGFVASLKNILELDNLVIPSHPEYINALGAALYIVGKN